MNSRDPSPYKNLNEYSNMHMNQSPKNQSGLVVTSTGTYNIDYNAAYAARKNAGLNRSPISNSSQNRSISPNLQNRRFENGESNLREELIKECESQFKERSRSGDRTGPGGFRSRDASATGGVENMQLFRMDELSPTHMVNR